MSRRVRRVRSSFSSWLMASGMARSHRGLAGALDPGQPVAFVRVGTISGAHVFRQVSRRFYKMQDPGPFLRGSHKGSYGTVRKGEGEPEPSGGPPRARTSGPESVALADQGRHAGSGAARAAATRRLLDWPLAPRRGGRAADHFPLPFGPIGGFVTSSPASARPRPATAPGTPPPRPAVPAPAATCRRAPRAPPRRPLAASTSPRVTVPARQRSRRPRRRLRNRRTFASGRRRRPPARSSRNVAGTAVAATCVFKRPSKRENPG